MACGSPNCGPFCWLLIRFRWTNFEVTPLGRRGDLFSWVRRTCLSAGRQRTKVVQHLRGVVVASVGHYDCVLLEHERIACAVSGQRRLSSQVEPSNSGNCVAALFCPHLSAVLSWFPRCGVTCFPRGRSPASTGAHKRLFSGGTSAQYSAAVWMFQSVC